jgi:hypothetical protein
MTRDVRKRAHFSGGDIEEMPEVLGAISNTAPESALPVSEEDASFGSQT